MDILEQISKATGMPIRSLMQYGLITGVVLVMLGIGQTYIVTLLGVAYPAFMSFLALESEGLDDDKMWLTYWVCFGCFNILDQFAGIILSIIPFYYFLKLGFLVYLYHPSTEGALTVYKNILRPRFQAYASQIDQMEKSVQDKMKEASSMASQAMGKKD